jgi:hypothetical protein
MIDMVCSFADMDDELVRTVLEIEKDGDDVVLLVDGHRIWVNAIEIISKIVVEVLQECQ